MSRVQCQYFGKCAGCQYQVRSSQLCLHGLCLIHSTTQMLSYEKQLDLKRDTVVEAYKNYSGQFSVSRLLWTGT